MVILVAAFILGGGLLGYFFRDGSSTESEIPFIKAVLPIKARPDQPGGIDIPHQDVTIFEKLDPQSEASAPKVEHLLPPAETPRPVMPSTPDNPISAPTAGSFTVPDHSGPEIERDLAPRKDQIADLPKKDKMDPPASNNETPFMAPEPENAPQLPVKQSKPQSVPMPQIKEVPEIKKEKNIVEQPPAPKKLEKTQEPKADAPQKHAPTTMGSLPAELFRTGEVPVHLKAPQASVPAPPASRRRIQLAAAPDKATAAAEMVRLQSKYGTSLSGAKLLLLQGSAAGKTVYRIQSVPLPEDEARKICASLQEKKASCLLVRP